MSQRKPSAPVTMNAHRHPQLSAIMGTKIGVRIAPTLLPALKIPVAKARSFFGNHSAVALMAPGKLPDSPKPSAARAIEKPFAVLASACDIAARLHVTIATA